MSGTQPAPMGGPEPAGGPAPFTVLGDPDVGVCEGDVCAVPGTATGTPQA